LEILSAASLASLHPLSVKESISVFRLFAHSPKVISSSGVAVPLVIVIVFKSFKFSAFNSSAPI
jgi:hypothetical protein